MNLSRVLNPPKPFSIERRLKSYNNEYDFKWNQPYLSRGLHLSCGSSSLNSASGGLDLEPIRGLTQPNVLCDGTTSAIVLFWRLHQINPLSP